MELPDGQQNDSLGNARTCSEAWLDPTEDKRLEEVAQLVAQVVRVPRELEESFRVLEYKRGQQFAAHTDYYEVEHFQNQPKIRQALQNGRNWLVTVFLYLKSPKSGGQTYFPSTYGKPLPLELDKCEGPAVTPRRGNALIFYSLHPDSTPNLSSIHGACKVERGVKYTVNIWLWNQAERKKQKARKSFSSSKSSEL